MKQLYIAQSWLRCSTQIIRFLKDIWKKVVSSLDKGTSKSNDKLNFGPVSISITFSKINKKVTVNLMDTTLN